jgi:hypothetical protein
VPKRKARCWRDKKEKRHMVMGEDVVMSEIPSLLGLTTMGNFSGKMVWASSLAI